MLCNNSDNPEGNTQNIKQKCPIFGFFGLWIRGNPNPPVQRELFAGLCEKKFPWVTLLLFLKGFSSDVR